MPDLDKELSLLKVSFSSAKSLSVSLLGILLALLVMPVNSGCNRRPDPKANPNFNEKALTDPGSALKDTPDASSGKPPKGK